MPGVCGWSSSQVKGRACWGQDPEGLRGPVINIVIIGSSISARSPSILFILPTPAAPFDDRQMDSEIPYSITRGQKDEEGSHSDVPILEPELSETQERPIVRNFKHAFARNLPRTYRTTSKALLYLRGPRPKRDLDGALSVLWHQYFAFRSNTSRDPTSANSLSVFDIPFQSSNVVAPFRASVDSVHTPIHPSFPLRPLRRRLPYRSRILHSSAVVPNTSGYIIQLYRYLLAGQQPVRFGREGLSAHGIHTIRL